MKHRVVVVGAGVGGLSVANRLARRAPDTEVVVLDGHADHLYQPGFVYLPFAPGADPRIRLTRGLLAKQARLRIGRVQDVDPDARRLDTENGERIAYDQLVLATGSRIAARVIPGFRDGAFHFHCRNRAVMLRQRLGQFNGGDLVVGATRLPYKCPASPFEFALLLEDHLRRDGRRSRTRLHFVYPTPELNEDPQVDALFRSLLEQRGFEIRTPFQVVSLHPERSEVAALSGEVLRYDLLVLAPPHTGTPFLRECGLANEAGWLPVDAETLRLRDGIYALGDAAELPAPKLGSGAHAQAPVVVENVLAELAGKQPQARYDGRSVCLVETGRRRAAVVSTAYDRTPPVRRPGRLPFLAKRAFNRVYFRLIARG